MPSERGTRREQLLPPQPPGQDSAAGMASAAALPEAGTAAGRSRSGRWKTPGRLQAPVRTDRWHGPSWGLGCAGERADSRS